MNQVHGNIEVRENDVRCIACGKTLEFNWDFSLSLCGRGHD